MCDWRLEIGYTTEYEFFKESYGQGSFQTMPSQTVFIPWDGKTTFREIVEEHEPAFVKAARLQEDGDKNHAVVFEKLKIIGEKSTVTVAIEPEKVVLSRG